jgi:hypothetical protein
MGAPFFPWIFLASVFLCGCLASAVFGTDSSGGVGYNILTGIVAAVCFYVAMIAAVIAMWAVGFTDVPEAVGLTVYLLLLGLPFTIVVSLLLSIVGSIFGWGLAQAIER